MNLKNKKNSNTIRLCDCIYCGSQSNHSTDYVPVFNDFIHTIEKGSSEHNLWHEIDVTRKVKCLFLCVYINRLINCIFILGISIYRSLFSRSLMIYAM